MLSVSSLFSSLTRVGVYVGVCVCVRTHTHTHCTDWVLGCEPRGRDETPGEPKESRLNLGIYMFVYVYKVHMFMYLLGGGMRSWTNCFFLEYIFPSVKEKQKTRKTTDNLKSKKDLSE